MNTINTLREVRLSQLAESKTNPRRHFDEAGMNELIESVKTKGVIQPLIVREVFIGDGRGVQFEIIAGARRFRAAKAAGLETVPVLVRELSDEDALEIQVIENLQRADVHPLDEAEGYARLIKANRYDVPHLASKIGKSPTHVYQRLKLNNLNKEFKNLMWEGRLPLGSAIHLARLTSEQQEKLGGWHHQNYRDADSVREIIRREFMLDLGKAAFSKGDQTLLADAPACELCPDHTGSNPELFADLGKGDMCLNGACFKKKLDVHMQREREKLEKSGKKVVAITASYYSSKKDVRHADQYDVVPKAKAEAFGMVVEGDGIGKVVPIAFKREKTEASTDSYATKLRNEQKKRLREQEIRRAIYGEAFVAIADSVTSKDDIDGVLEYLLDADVKQFIGFLVNLLSSDTQKAMLKALVLEPVKKKQHGYTHLDTVTPLIKFITSTPSCTIAFLRTAVYVGGLTIWSHSGKIGTWDFEKDYPTITGPVRKKMEVADKGKKPAKKAKKGKAA